MGDSGTAMRSVVIAEDSAAVRERLRAQLAGHADIEVVGETDDAEPTIEALVRWRPDGVVLDLQLRSSSGIRVLEFCRKELPSTRVVVLTNHAHNPEYRRRCLDLGAVACLDKSLDFEFVPALLGAAPLLAPAVIPELRAFADEIQDVVMFTDARGRITFVNAAWRALSGLSPEETLGRNCMEFVHPGDHAASLALLRGLLSDGASVRRYEVRILHRDGRAIWAEVNARVLRDSGGRTIGLSGTLREISERRAAEAALRLSEARFRAVVEATYDAIVVSENGVILEVNRGFREILGYHADDVVGRRLIEFIAPECLPLVADRIARRTPGRYEIRALDRDGRRVDLEVMATFVQVEDRELRLSALHDVTARRELERQSLAAQRFEAMGVLAAGVAHDFNNILSGIIMGAELLALSAPDGHPCREDLEFIHGAADRGMQLTRQLLAMARSEDAVPVQPLDVNVVVRNVEGVLRMALGVRCELVLVTTAEPALILAAEGPLDHALLNLATNARDAMPDGGVLTLTTEIVDLGERVRLVVADTGAGMPPDVLERAFDLLFTTKAPGQGTGLGLPSVKRTVERFGGTIGVRSEPGRGTAFTMQWPRARDGQT